MAHVRVLRGIADRARAAVRRGDAKGGEVVTELWRAWRHDSFVDNYWVIGWRATPHRVPMLQTLDVKSGHVATMDADRWLIVLDYYPTVPA